MKSMSVVVTAKSGNAVTSRIFVVCLVNKSFVTLTGDVGSVNAAVSAGVEVLADQGLIQSYVVIPSPSKELYTSLV